VLNSETIECETLNAAGIELLNAAGIECEALNPSNPSNKIKPFKQK
jgi:hypothetical protein